MKEEKVCENCKYWTLGHTNSYQGFPISFGLCKRFPKSEEKIDRDTCGEFSPSK